MDLYAYTQIDSLHDILSSTGVDVPRLRGLRLMLEEEPISDEDIAEAIHDEQMYVAERIIQSVPKWSPNSNVTRYNWETDRACRKYLVHDADGKVTDVRWELIHGQHKKNMKHAMKIAKRRVLDSFGTFNRYAGRDDILCVHARIGGRNWGYYNRGGAVSGSDAFIEKVDDMFDDTYCDIYLRIDPKLAHAYVEGIGKDADE